MVIAAAAAAEHLKRYTFSTKAKERDDEVSPSGCTGVRIWSLVCSSDDLTNRTQARQLSVIDARGGSSSISYSPALGLSEQ